MLKVDDGLNDITMMRADKSRLQMAKALIKIDDGDYFVKNGDVDPGLGMEYIRTKTWHLSPQRKGPVPENLNYHLPEGTQTFPDECFSIDGEKYPAQDCKGTVLQKVLRVYC